jgi:hypothetical protein
VGIVINAVVTYLAVLLALAAGARIYRNRMWREWLGILLVASPAFLMYGSSILRECWAWLTVSIAIHGLIWLVRGAAWTGTLAGILAVGLAFWIRSPLAPILVAATVAGVLTSAVWRRYGTVAAVSGLAALGAAGRLAVIPALAAVGYSPEGLTIARDYLSSSATTAFPPADPFSVVGLAQSLLRVGAGPFLWEFRLAPAWAWVFLNWAYWALVVLLTTKALRRTGLNSANVAVVVFAIVLLAGLAIGLTNYGIVVRMRAAAALALLPVVWGLLPTADPDHDHDHDHDHDQRFLADDA